MLPLAAHCLDVSLVFRALCDLRGIQRSLARGAGAPLSAQQSDRLAVLAMLHDIGKANLGFQDKVFSASAPRAGHVRELAPLLDSESPDQELASRFVACLPPEMAEWFEQDGSDYSYFMATFSHHGSPLWFRGERTGVAAAARTWWQPRGPRDPMRAIAEVGDWARLAFPEAFRRGGPPLPSGAPFHHQFAGLVTLADWIGSHQQWFPIGPTTCEARLAEDRRVIPELLRTIGLDGEYTRTALPSWPDFTSRFGMVPKALQAAIDQLAVGEAGTELLIAESETGSGKTEAALNWFFKLYQAGEVDALYFALPTRVAATELFDRVAGTINRWFPPDNRPVTVLAVPGYTSSRVSPDDPELPTARAGQRYDDDQPAPDDHRWAAQQPKRFLAATVAVGTIDQALLSTVQARHAHLRSVLLDRSLLVVDEVHSSDVYMSRLLHQLIGHHVSVGGRAILLSATLGAADRSRYAAAASPSGPATVPPPAVAVVAPYPALTLGHGGTLPVPSEDLPKEVQFELRPWTFQPESAVVEITAALAAGARVLVVMNTVARANGLLRALEAAIGPDHPALFRYAGVACPHHGRFALPDRRALDAEVKRGLGQGSPPGARLLVGTQTLEQSLDIDTDLLVTDLAPADVLLQRVGRLHRHQRRRPPGYAAARCVVLTPPGTVAEGLDERGRVVALYQGAGYGSVYEDLRVLELTREMLVAQPVVRLPAENRRLVEGATHPAVRATLAGDRWAKHGQSVDGAGTAEAMSASAVVIPRDQYFGRFEFNELGGRAATRLGLDSLQLSLDRPVVSPFGHPIRELVIPRHLSPKSVPEMLTVQSQDTEVVRLSAGDRVYQYTRYGLEVMP